MTKVQTGIISINIRDMLIGALCAAIVFLSFYMGTYIIRESDEMKFLECEGQKRSFILREQEGMFSGSILRGCIEQ